MGSTISSSTFRSYIRESIEINGIKQEAATEHSVSNVTDYNHRILTLSADSTSTIVTYGSSNAAGQINKDAVQYIKATNLDDETNLRLIINLITDAPAAAGSFHVELKPLKSHLISTKSAAIVAAGGNFAAYNTVSTIQAVTPAGKDVDIELFYIVS